MGKTSLCMDLQKYMRVYWAPIQEKWLNEYEDGCYDLVVFDEFKGQHTISFMNQFVSGGPLAIPIKMQGIQPVKKENVPVIVLSNYPIIEAYGGVDEARARTLEARFTEVCVETFIDILHNTIEIIADTPAAEFQEIEND